MKTSELTGAALDWAVGMALGHDMSKAINLGAYLRIPAHTGSAYTVTFCPSTDWTLGGSIIEQDKLGLMHVISGGTSYWVSTGYLAEECGPTLLIAAMRCFVAGKLGDDVTVPDGLV
jgi:hypothetical protein